MGFPSDRHFIRRLAACTLLGAGLAAFGCGKSVTAPVVIPPLSRVVIAFGGDTTVVADTLTLGFTEQFTATPFDTNGVPVFGLPLTWRSSDLAIFSVTSTGRVRGLGEGQALLTVQVGGVADSVELMVLPAGGGWNPQTSNSGRQLNDVFFASDGRHGWVVGDAGEILATTDAGENWIRQTSNTAFNLNAVWFTDADSGWAVGGAGAALHTRDGGANWTPMTTTASETLHDVFFATPDTGFAVGNNGVILRTTDFGASWIKQYPTGFALYAVSFAGTRHGWAVGDNGTILGTVDRGISWTLVAPSVTAQSLHGVWRRSVTVAYAAGLQGVAPRTVDVLGTPTWELQNTGASNQLEDVSFPTDGTGFVVGNNGAGLVLRTDNSGVTWLPQTVTASNALRGVHFVDELRGWVVGDGGRIFHTTSGGEP